MHLSQVAPRCPHWIGAAGNNSTGIAGLNWSVKMMAIRHDADYDSTDPSYSHRMYWSVNLAAWDYVLKMKRRGVNIRVTSNSYGQRGIESAAVREAIEAAGQEGILSVFTGGNRALNEDFYATFPASFNLASAINVTASSASDTLADFGNGYAANYGPSTVHLAAPGVNIFSTSKGASYATGDGGSYACPLVAGAAALLLSANPNLTVNEMKAAILGSVDQPAALKGKLITIVTPHGSATTTALFQVLPPPLSITFNSINRLEITWPGTSSAFVLEVSQDLASGAWVPVAQAPVEANGKSKITLAPGSRSSFYRLKGN